MNRAIFDILNKQHRQIFVFATIFLVLLSSCSIKTTIKTLAGIPANTESSLPKSNRGFSSPSLGVAEKCAEIGTSDIWIAKKISINANALSPIFLFTASFLFLIGFRPASKESRHPIYSDSSKIRSSIPIFLEYRKLIVHFSH